MLAAVTKFLPNFAENCFQRLSPQPSVVVVGDVHGWPDRLATVLAAVEDETAYAILVGDCNDRGPDSATTIAEVRRLIDAGQAAMVMGNHEYALCRAMGSLPYQLQDDGSLSPDWDFADMWVTSPWGGLETLQSYGVTSVAEAIDQQSQICDDARWLAHLPWWLECPLVTPGTGDSDSAEESIIHVTHVGVPATTLADCKKWFAEQYHAALFAEPTLTQALPDALFIKNLTHSHPVDVPATHYVVSGHVPQADVLRSHADRRWVIDTSGGKASRRLSGIVLPQCRVVSG